VKVKNLRISLRLLRRMPFSGICCRVSLVRIDVSEESIASVFREETILDSSDNQTSQP
jgi:hypothetical protein